MGLRGVVLVWLAALIASTAHANGRLPGATELAINRSDRDHLIARATFGMVQSFDGGGSWQWICERAVNVSGEADPPVAVTEDGTIVLLPPARGTLISRDRGCTWEPAPAPFVESRAIDLTVDPNEPARVLVVLSSVDTIDDQGVVAYENVLLETRDNARTWSEVSRLPSSFFIETLEIAASDPDRIYVGGTSSTAPSLGIVQRSEDGGETWTETSVELPPGSGSMFISAIDPSDPDRLWVRLPARGDRFGILPAALIMSGDKGESWEMIAATANQAMLGFALSPDGTQLAYGGPGDGLFIGASDGSDGFEKLSELRVRCLRWNSDGLYACGTESLGDPFSVGVSTDDGATFEPIYMIEDTCPQECPESTDFEMTCKDDWSALAPVLEFSGESCSVPWARPPEPDAGARDASVDAEVDAGDASAEVDAASADASAAADGGCACNIASRSERTPRGLITTAWGILLLIAMRKRWPLIMLLTAITGCGDDGSMNEPSDEADAAVFVACPDSIPELEPGVAFTGRDGKIRVEILGASPMPARKYRNDWTIAFTDANGDPLDDVEITRFEAYMPVHEHFSRPPVEVELLDEPGELDATVHFIMRGPWEVQIEASSASAGDDYVVLDVCVEN
jgi:photosystem II stability/assembly factor-like uncharacterized protein